MVGETETETGVKAGVRVEMEVDRGGWKSKRFDCLSVPIKVLHIDDLIESNGKVSVRQLARARENPNVGRLRESDREPRSTAFHNLPNGTY